MKTIITLFITLTVSVFHAQHLEWVNQIGGIGQDISHTVTVDASGNVYSTGHFSGIVDFDPGPGEFMLTSDGFADIFIAKCDASGSLVWVKRIGGDSYESGNSIAVDAFGNVLTIGSFADTVDFDPGEGAHVLMTEPGTFRNGTIYINTSDLFISKLDAFGNFVWAKQFGGSGQDHGAAIAADASGNVITAGKYSNGYWGIDTADFDPGPEVFNLIGGGGFISKLDPAGNFVWAKQFGEISGVSSISGNGITIYTKFYSIDFQSFVLDASGNIYTTGLLDWHGDFDPGEGMYNLSPIGNDDIFISKLDHSGNLAWVKQLGGSGAFAYGQDIAIDGSGNILTTGYFKGQVDFNPGTGTDYLTSNTPEDYFADVFVSKLDNSGNFAWARHWGGSADDEGSSIAIDAQGNVYTTGWFTDEVDFDPASSEYFLTASEEDIFTSKLDSSGTLVWARKLGGTGYDRGTCITVDANTNVLTTGYFAGTVDFDPDSDTYNLISTGDIDAFVQKLKQTVITSTADQSPAPTFSIFPNPAQEKVTISFTDDKVSKYEILLYDMTGRLVTKCNGISHAGDNKLELYIGHIVKNMYQVLVIIDDTLVAKMLVVE